MFCCCCIICRFCAVNYSNWVTASTFTIPKRPNAGLSTISAAIAATTTTTTSRAKCIEYCFYITGACQYGKAAKSKCHSAYFCSSACTPRSNSAVQRIKFSLKWTIWYIPRCWCTRYVPTCRAPSPSCSSPYAIYFHPSKREQCSGDADVW